MLSERNIRVYRNLQKLLFVGVLFFGIRSLIVDLGSSEGMALMNIYIIMSLGCALTYASLEKKLSKFII